MAGPPPWQGWPCHLSLVIGHWLFVTCYLLLVTVGLVIDDVREIEGPDLPCKPILTAVTCHDRDGDHNRDNGELSRPCKTNDNTNGQGPMTNDQ